MATRSKPKGKGKGKSKVKVVVRLRPLLDHESAEEQCISDVSEDSLQLWNYRTQNDTLKYTFDACYRCGVEQEAIFSREVQPLLPLILKGQNATCFAFGPTGAGKTFTMQGSPRCPGMIPRSIDHLFAAIDADEPKVNRSVTLSFLQIHQEKVYDLLEVSDKDLPVREDYDGRIVVPGLAEVSVRSSEEFHQVYERGLANRATSATALNSHSSRSHAVLTVKVTTTTMAECGSTQVIGKLNLIDLAGSEDNRKTNNSGERMKESTAINKSLFVLNQVVDALNKRHMRVPYRDSKLTRLLQDSLGGRSIATIITCLSPGMNLYQNTYHALNFAAKSRNVSNTPFINSSTSSSAATVTSSSAAVTSSSVRGSASGSVASVRASGTTFAADSVQGHTSRERAGKNAPLAARLGQAKRTSSVATAVSGGPPAKRNVQASSSCSSDRDSELVKRVAHLEACLDQLLHNGSAKATSTAQQVEQIQSSEKLVREDLGSGLKRSKGSLQQPSQAQTHQSKAMKQQDVSKNVEGKPQSLSDSRSAADASHDQDGDALMVALSLEDRKTLARAKIDEAKACKQNGDRQAELALYKEAQRLIPTNDKLNAKIVKLEDALSHSAADSAQSKPKSTHPATHKPKGKMAKRTGLSDASTLQQRQVKKLQVFCDDQSAPTTLTTTKAKRRVLSSLPTQRSTKDLPLTKTAKMTQEGASVASRRHGFKAERRRDSDELDPTYEPSDDEQVDAQVECILAQQQHKKAKQTRRHAKSKALCAMDISPRQEQLLLACINQSTEKELLALPGIGKQRARNILSNRSENGTLTQLSQLVELATAGTVQKLIAHFKTDEEAEESGEAGSIVGTGIESQLGSMVTVGM
eukprot:m.328258 g.328258  ORF g.328258 m.328258 type:complete len:865 (-) comp16032_c0_seq2:219-2813(-)